MPAVSVRNPLSGVLLSIALATLALSVNAGGVADWVTVNDPYIRAVPPVVKTSAAFLQLRNDGPQERFLVDAATPAAGAVELHMHQNDDNVMRMRQIPHIHMPAGKNVSLQPGGLHIMLFDLASRLREGDEYPITLTFDDGSTKEIKAVVRSVKRMMRH